MLVSTLSSMRLRALPFVLFFALSTVSASGLSPVALSPRETVLRFDSLVEAGAAQEALDLCTGDARRLLPFLIEASAKVAPFIDTARSLDTILEEKVRGNWVALRVRSETVFIRPLMGLSRLTSLQALHLYRDPAAAEASWKIAGFEELPSEKTPLVPRQGIPKGSEVGTSLLPVSRHVPVRTGATRLRMRVSLRGGNDPNQGGLPIVTGTAGQSVLERGPDRDWVRIETRRASLPKPLLANSPAVSAVYLASTPDLDLSDPLLKKKAIQLKMNSPHDVETTRRIYAFVSTSFDFKLGASLFSNSREALRDLKGDCSEAAVLTAALIRASGIPSRVMMGFASVDRGVFIGHAWAEAWLGGEWIGVDPALHQFPSGAERVALLALSGEMPLQPLATNLMISTLSNLDIEIEAAWNGNEKLELEEPRGSDKDAREFLDKVLKGMLE